ncbi:MAG: pyruvate formate-lyase-activating protein [Defluviitaleaceae bacterium]|nr:pyruvate formate-lyase-activating protein [Defluviitaleaceae bacterium]
MKLYDEKTLGYIHSIYTGGMVDGPGIRTVVFTSGCSLRCLYCHNPDTWIRTRGYKKNVAEVLDDVMKYRSYYKYSGGGITISGGEPSDQPRFLKEILIACRENGVHTALDTSGFATAEAAEEILPYVDLLILDFKAYDPRLYFRLTGQRQERPLQTLREAQYLKIPTWVRFVLVPGLTDDFDDLAKMSAFLKQHDNIEKVEVLPFHKHGEHKWDSEKYTLHNTEPPSPELLAQVQKIFE